MQTRRRVLLAGISGTVSLLSGCSGGTNRTPTESGSTTTATQISTTATESTLPYEKEWNDITVEKGSGWIHEIPAFEKQAELSYTVTNTASVNFDVYVFEKGFDSGLDKYKEYINNGENADGVLTNTQMNRRRVPVFLSLLVSTRSSLITRISKVGSIEHAQMRRVQIRLQSISH